MNLKRSIALLLSILLLSLFIPTTLAFDDDGLAIGASNAISQELVLDSGSPPTAADKMEDTRPTFRAELTEDGIYGTLSYIPDGTEDISVLYSMGGLTYTIYGYGWDLTSLDEGMTSLRQLCLSADMHPVEAFRRKAINRLFIKLEFLVDGERIQTEPVVFSNALNIPIPETPPPFIATISYSEYSGYGVKGRFTDIPANVVRIRPMYSLDGQMYQTVQGFCPNDWILNTLGTEDEFEKRRLENQVCLLKNNEPLKSYLANKLDRFYVRLQITTDDGDFYDTQAALIERGTVQPSPEGLTVLATFPGTMFDAWEAPSQARKDGQYQITVRENATPEDLQSLLPDTLPVKVSFLQKNTSEFFTSGIVECKVKWKELPDFHLTAGEVRIIPDAANGLTVPVGTQVTTSHGRYTLENSLVVGSALTSGKVQLMLNVVGIDEKPDVSLSTATILHWETLSLAFRQKPSGATSIKAYAFIEEDGEPTEIGELLSLRDLNHNQWAQLYGYVPLLRPDESPFKEYLDGEIPSLSIAIEIEGGTFDGEQITLTWPGEYDPPSEIPEDDSEGNKGDVGSDGSEDGDSSDNGGQRPNLPSDGEDSSDSDSSDREPLRPTGPEIKLPLSVTEVATAPKSLPETPIVAKGIVLTDSPSALVASDNSDTADTPLAPALLEPSTEAVPTAPPETNEAFVQPEPIPERKIDGVWPIMPAAAIALLFGGLAVAVGASTASGAGWLAGLKKVLGAILRYK